MFGLCFIPILSTFRSGKFGVVCFREGRLVVVPLGDGTFAARLLRLAAREQVTCLNQTPCGLRQIVKLRSPVTKAFSLRHVIFGGEALYFANLLPWFRRHGDAATATREHVRNHGDDRARHIPAAYRSRRPERNSQFDRCSDTRSALLPARLEAASGAARCRRRNLCWWRRRGERLPQPTGADGRAICTGSICCGFVRRSDVQVGRPSAVPRVRRSRISRSWRLASENSRVSHRTRRDRGSSNPAHRCAPMRRCGSPGSTREQKLVTYFVPMSLGGTNGTQLREFLQKKLPAHMIRMPSWRWTRFR